MYAIIETGGKQYKVSQGDRLLVDRLPVEPGQEVRFDKVLAIGGESTKLGEPYVKGASVTANVVNQGKAKKIVVFKFKPKSTYRKKQGHRQPFTKIEITSIND